MAAVFLSYRRADASAAAGRLFDRLAARFGADAVFRDLDSIEAGADFAQSIEAALADAAVVLVLIGPYWLQARAESGGRRLDKPQDYVRRELEIALASPALVVPVLVEGARFPAQEALPASIRGLALRNAVELTERHWQEDCEALLRQVQALGVVSISNPAEDAGRNRVHATVAHFFPNLLDLLRQPRTFLRAAVRGERSDVAAALAFYLGASLLAFALLSLGYTPRRGFAFAFSVVAGGLFLAVSGSVPLWIGWRLVGARRHYPRLLAVALYQVSVLQLLALGAAAIVALALDLRSRDALPALIAEAMRPGATLQGAVANMRSQLLPLVASTEVKVACLFVVAIVAGALVWFACAWGGFRDALRMNRLRSIAALAIATSLVAAAGLLARHLVRG